MGHFMTRWLGHCDKTVTNGTYQQILWTFLGGVGGVPFLYHQPLPVTATEHKLGWNFF